jgi:pimeloyl-ACP methyl ester carboxylesterase
MAPRHMADWVEAWMAADLISDCRAVTAPTQVITGDARLDRVVPVESSIDYLELIPGARHVAFSRTGHMGLLMRPDDFAALVAG